MSFRMWKLNARQALMLPARAPVNAANPRRNTVPVGVGETPRAHMVKHAKSVTKFMIVQPVMPLFQKVATPS